MHVKSIGDVLESIFDDKLMTKAEEYSGFFSCWKDLTEKNGFPAAAAHSWIKNLDNGLVWIEVDHPGWKQIIQANERKLLYDFRYRFPKMGISGISIMLCRPGTRPGNAKGKTVAETAVIKERPQTDSFDAPAAAADDQTRNSGYDGIKNNTLKKLLMSLEKSINERDS